MTSAAGTAALVVAFLASGVLTISAAVAAAGHRSVVRWIRPAVTSLLGGAAVAMAVLVSALLRDDFSIVYTAEEHALATPFPFDVATAWAALDGSIVLWLLVLSGFVAAVARTVDRKDRQGQVALAVMGVVCLFFAGLTVLGTNPFTPMDVVPLDGPGPNPLLQNHVLMAVHPPLLYVGYVGMTVPFAFGIAALVTVDARRQWIERTRRWTLTAWTFLTAGIVIGGLWSYEVLGWGGYWAWDPVENASLLPWLTATAFIHSAIGQLRRGVLRSWNVLLAIVTFELTIFGTFLTRSGVVASVHSFTQSPIGPALLVFLVATLVASLGLYAARAQVIVAGPKVDRLRSREGAFLVNNLLLSVLTFVVLVGTTFPIVLEAVNGTQVSVGRPFFDRFAAPIGLLIVAAAAAGPLLPHRAARPGLLRHKLRWPMVVALAVATVVAAVGTTSVPVVAVSGLATLVAAAVFVNARDTVSALPGRPLAAFMRTTRRSRGWWGGQLSHLGLALLAVGITTSGSLGQTTTITLDVGDTALFGGYDLRLEDVTATAEPQRDVQTAVVAVTGPSGRGGVLRPRLNRYTATGTVVATPDVLTRPTQDLYLSLRRLEPDSVTLEVFRYPFMWLVWAGGLTIVAGGAWALTAPVHRRRRVEPHSATPDSSREPAHA